MFIRNLYVIVVYIEIYFLKIVVLTEKNILIHKYIYISSRKL